MPDCLAPPDAIAKGTSRYLIIHTMPDCTHGKIETVLLIARPNCCAKTILTIIRPFQRLLDGVKSRHRGSLAQIAPRYKPNIVRQVTDGLGTDEEIQLRFDISLL
jgi:hypothetical protein